MNSSCFAIVKKEKETVKINGTDNNSLMTPSKTVEKLQNYKAPESETHYISAHKSGSGIVPYLTNAE